MLYIVVASALYFAFVMVFSIVLNLDCIEFTGEWGKLLNTLANTTMGTKFQLGFSPERNVINMFSPISAMWFTFLHSSLDFRSDTWFCNISVQYENKR